MRRLLGRPGADERGTTLSELVVVMLILGIVTAATAALTIGFQRTNAQNITRQDQIDVARTAVERMSKTIRTAVKPSQLLANCSGGCSIDAFVRAEAFSVQFYANLDNPGNSVGPSRIVYSVAATGPDAGVLIEKVQRPDTNPPVTSAGYTYCDAEAAGATTECQSRLTVQRLAVGVVTSAASPLFSYYDSNGSVMTPVSGGSLTASQLEKVLSIEIDVNVETPNATRAAPTQYIQRVTLPNSQAVLRSGQDPTP
ncbi:type II secretion system protein J [Cellulomonas sp. P24]|uniref:PulJ/GspJ family protein n=1 Tax=Cellulomonas sp. P24 TaxID=2885206 RepID=UPI00216AE4D2|nr:type II secretion system protein [Cellulomonas sp. P24]